MFLCAISPSKNNIWLAWFATSTLVSVIIFGWGSISFDFTLRKSYEVYLRLNTLADKQCLALYIVEVDGKEKLNFCSQSVSYSGYSLLLVA